MVGEGIVSEAEPRREVAGCVVIRVHGRNWLIPGAGRVIQNVGQAVQTLSRVRSPLVPQTQVQGQLARKLPFVVDIRSQPQFAEIAKRIRLARKNTRKARGISLQEIED